MRDIVLGVSQRKIINDLNASGGRLTKFMERNKFGYRQITNLIALSDDKFLQRIFEHLKSLQSQILQSQPKNTTLIDELVFYLEDPRRTTIAPVISRQILLKTTCFASMRIVVVLTV